MTNPTNGALMHSYWNTKYDYCTCINFAHAKHVVQSCINKWRHKYMCTYVARRVEVFPFNIREWSTSVQLKGGYKICCNTWAFMEETWLCLLRLERFWICEHSELVLQFAIKVYFNYTFKWILPLDGTLTRQVRRPMLLVSKRITATWTSPSITFAEVSF